MMNRRLLLLLLLALLFVRPVQAQADALLAQINALRESVGVHPYSLNSALNSAAQSHANWMATTKEISHNQPGGSTPSTRAAAAGYPSRWVSENIYGGTGAAMSNAWNFWINSPIHYRGLTSANYYDLGIGIASADGWTFFVLVFGNATNSWGGTVVGGGNNNANNGGGNASANVAPVFIVGWDEYGNIMHEIQEEQTLGDILLLYGYTWDDLPNILALNKMSDADIRRLEIGSVLLVPPKGGTHTPTPYPEGFATPTPNNDDAVSTAIANAILRETAVIQTQRASVLLTPIFTPTAFASPTVPVLDASPSPSPTAEKLVSAGKIPTSASVPALLAQAPTPAPQTTIPTAQTTVPASNDNTTLLVIVIVAQALVISLAGLDYLRRRAKS